MCCHFWLFDGVKCIKIDPLTHFMILMLCFPRDNYDKEVKAIKAKQKKESRGGYASNRPRKPNLATYVPPNARGDCGDSPQNDDLPHSSTSSVSSLDGLCSVFCLHSISLILKFNIDNLPSDIISVCLFIGFWVCLNTDKVYTCHFFLFLLGKLLIMKCLVSNAFLPCTQGMQNLLFCLIICLTNHSMFRHQDCCPEMIPMAPDVKGLWWNFLSSYEASEVMLVSHHRHLGTLS